MTPYIILGGFVFTFVLLIAFFELINRKHGPLAEEKKAKYTYVRRRYLMTRTELSCYRALAHGFRDKYFVFAQVHLPELVTEKVPGQNWKAARSHIDRKSVDFVITDTEEIKPLLAIELDDWSHNREDRQERDREVERILDEAGVPLLRITDMEDLIGRVERKMNVKEHSHHVS